MSARTVLGLGCALTLAYGPLKSDALANVPVVVSPGEQSEPVMVSDGAGGAIVAWQDFRGGAESDIYAQRIGPDGASMWTAGGVAVCTAATFQTLPRIVSDGAGGAILGWTDYRNGNGDIYVQRLNPTGVPLWTSGGLPICDDGQPQLGVELTTDGNGGVIAVWEDYRLGPEGDLFAQRVSIGGVPAWGLNGVVVCGAAGAQTGPSVCEDGATGAIVIWRDQRASGSGDLYAQRLNAAGVRQWTLDGALVCGAAGGQYDPLVVPDLEQGAIATWSDERDGGLTDIYAQRIGAGSLPQWAADGVRICGAPSFQLFPVIAADDSGGAVIAWEDSRSDTTVDIYAQRVGPDGIVRWATDGILVCDSEGYESLPTICTDGGGGAIITWQDQRNLGDDVFAQRISGAGMRLWPASGIPVSLASGAQLSPVLTSDGNGGALFVWYDGRNGDWDIYAQHADAWGGLGGTVGILPAIFRTGLQLAAPIPNPARGPVRIGFSLAQAAGVDLAVFDAAGRRVRSLPGGDLPGGSHTRTFDLRDDGGGRLPPGLYFIRLRSAGRTALTRLVTIP